MVSSLDFQNRPILYSFFIFFNYLQNDGLLHFQFLTDQNGAPGTPGIHLTYFNCLRGARPDSEFGFSRVYLNWNFAYFADQKPVS